MGNYYDVYHKFLTRFKDHNFQSINRKDPLVLTIENKLAQSGQFLHVANITHMKIVYCSDGCHKFFGINPGEVDPAIYFERTHPDDIQRHSLGRSKLIRMGNEMFIKRAGSKILSTSMKTLNGNGEYVDLLYQLYICYFNDPVPVVYSLQINTDVSELKKKVKCDHYYVGEDENMFRYPDKELLSTGLSLSERESEIIRFISQGLDSEQIAKRLFLSVHTVNTHRRNILEKTGHKSTHELVIELQEKGVI